MTYILPKIILSFLLFVLIHVPIKAETPEQHIKVALRSMANEFLLQIDDSTSRILPIRKVNGRYKVEFETAFSFEPDLLFFSVFKTIEENGISQHFIVEVETCSSDYVVHSFKADSAMNYDKLACKHRILPKDCYAFYFTVLNEKKNALFAKQQGGNNLYYLIIILLVIICPLIWIIYKWRKKTSVLINIGQYKFDQKKMFLIHNKVTTELSSKEADLLLLLFSNENKTLERADILNIIWKDEGNYIGRTLDVFISKLRKKLQDDPNIKILNIRGVGYKFIIN